MSMPDGPASPGSYPPSTDQPAASPPPGPQSYYPTPGQPGYVEQPRKRNRTGLLILGALVVILVLIVGGVYVFRDRISGEAAGVAVGDCIDLPASDGTFSDVQHQPCNEPHDAEVILTLTHPAPAGEAYPVVSGFTDYIGQNCLPAFKTYTGRDFATEGDLDLGYFHPTLTGWGDGDRGFSCHVYRIDAAKMTASVRAGAPTSP